MRDLVLPALDRPAGSLELLNRDGRASATTLDAELD